MSYTAEWSEEEPSRAVVDALQGPVLVEFGAEWCPHCTRVQGELRRMLEGHPEVKHLKIADGKGKPLGRSFRVKLWPNFVFLRDGVVQAQLARPGLDELRDEVKALADRAS